MQYLGYTYIKNLFTVDPKFKYNWLGTSYYCYLCLCLSLLTYTIFHFGCCCMSLNLAGNQKGAEIVLGLIGVRWGHWLCLG
jgi:hypothetical protein